jgi:hypothetical protein
MTMTTTHLTTIRIPGQAVTSQLHRMWGGVTRWNLCYRLAWRLSGAADREDT